MDRALAFGARRCEFDSRRARESVFLIGGIIFVKRKIAAWLMLIVLVLSNCGCALLGAAASAAVSYAIYKATKH